MERTLFKGKLKSIPNDKDKKVMFEQCFCVMIRECFAIYKKRFGTMPKGLSNIHRGMPKVYASPDIVALATSLLAASLRDVTPAELHPRLFTILFACFGELVKHSNVYTTGYAHKGIGYLADHFVSKYARGKDEQEFDEILYENFSIFGNLVRGYVEGDYIEVISAPAQ
ncbi:hypothetical protein [Rhodoflexus caldus]|uniref:hypothetical protein n=1 Tax=Rhodoflexus caldus TaxID=2891236 RepID=UPI00202AB104|nr:hypothetical protein [Rhodoflexus caldus]